MKTSSHLPRFGPVFHAKGIFGWQWNAQFAGNQYLQGFQNAMVDLNDRGRPFDGSLIQPPAFRVLAMNHKGPFHGTFYKSASHGLQQGFFRHPQEL